MKKFKSLYSNSQVTAAQYITEYLCYLISKNNREELQDQFWKDKYWSRFFRRQVGLANKILKEYDVEAVIFSLKDRRLSRIKSFGAKFMLDPILKEYQSKIDFQKTKAKAPTPKFKITNAPRVVKSKKSIISRLEELE